ncbi:haloacid dehalogenase [Saccharobesus litoralis]|uniref:Haloacid dehalogenase n=1 Tax=Saccharobesus litoralis TaxID=2172099 RepID=A0A2S0VQF2_9ALTE|nr:HAD family hydrolase [Saccharobesus litoralis]AWB66438.1 haloacid dehalogenase [Saccharobesus litoralis]
MAQDPLPSWQDGALKSAILAFVDQVTDPNSSKYVVPNLRVATFDHDGTLFVEKPLNAQITFVKQKLFDEGDNPVMAPPNASFFDRLENKLANWMQDIESDLENISNAIFKDITPAQFRAAAGAWIRSAVHPRFQQIYQSLTYKPMLELLALLQDQQFIIYIVTGSSTDFIRQWSDETYNIGEQRILGSSLKTSLEEKDGKLKLVLEPIPFYFSNGANKVKSIERNIALQPIFAFGNSRGDIEMLRWAGQATTSFCGLVHHTDAEREYAYSPDPELFTGKSTLDQAQDYGWHVVDMKNDWLTVF